MSKNEETWPQKPLREIEKALGTQGILNWGFHRVVEDLHGMGFRFPGYLVGIEKAKRSIIKVDDSGEGGFPSVLFDSPKLNKQEKKLMRRRLDDCSRMFISHIVSYEAVNKPFTYISGSFIHNAYEKSNLAPKVFKESWLKKQSDGTLFEPYDQSRTPYINSWLALQKLEIAIEEDLKNARLAHKPISHVIVASMGWNTPQDEAITNFNSLFGNILNSTKEVSPKYIPNALFIGLSWPSQWLLPGISYFNKANDADEIGFIWANYIINGILLKLKAIYGFKVVLIGHSFGAKLITRAAFSQPVLDKTDVELQEKVDLIISLQGAFSANRFLSERKWGREGAPYSNYRKKASYIVLTWSRYDSANPLANWITSANHVGGVAGFRRMNDPRYVHHFKHIKWSENREWMKEIVGMEESILAVDASDFVRYKSYKQGGHAHSDIYHPTMGQFLADIIHSFAPPTAL